MGYLQRIDIEDDSSSSQTTPSGESSDERPEPAAASCGSKIVRRGEVIISPASSNDDEDIDALLSCFGIRSARSFHAGPARGAAPKYLQFDPAGAFAFLVFTCMVY